mmetsp:Transcript_69384/g.206682  ORF Transcript_69384/g.206682 Transcript_69384/m.206682 type:complete len:429 (+) Transcript_69384:594-1880(+)
MAAKQLNHQGEVVLVPRPVLARARVKQEVACQQLEEHARGTPDIRCHVPVRPHDYLRGSVLPGLDVVGHLAVGPTAIAKVRELGKDLVQRKRVQPRPLPHGRHRPAAGLGSSLLCGCLRICLLLLSLALGRLVPGLVGGSGARLGLLGCGALLLLLQTFLLALGKAPHQRLLLRESTVSFPALLHHELKVVPLDEDILKLDVCVYDAARVYVGETYQRVPRDPLDHGHRQPVVVEVLDERQKVLAHHLEHHALVPAIRAAVPEVTSHLHDSVGARSLQPLQQRDLVQRLLSDALLGFADLHSHKLGSVVAVLTPLVRAEPHRGESPRTQLGKHPVSTIVDLVRCDRVVAPAFVVARVVLVRSALAGGGLVVATARAAAAVAVAARAAAVRAAPRALAGGVLAGGRCLCFPLRRLCKPSWFPPRRHPAK